MSGAAMLGLWVFLEVPSFAAVESMTAPVGPGTYRPLFPPTIEEVEIAVPRFRMDVEPVTNVQFLAFVTEHPEWRRDRIRRVHADAGYLAHWSSPTALGSAMAEAPVVRVSWFAANAYCAARGARLPTVAQWELAAAASETSLDATGDTAFRQRILDWYARPTPDQLGPVGGSANAWGVRDLHGLVWEWTLDFNSELVANDARDQGDPDSLQFCGTGALGSTDPANYATFMRVAMRSSLQAAYTTSGLGFRCVEEAR